MTIGQAGLVYLGLLILLALTVGSAQLDLGPVNSALNLLIAAAKAALIGVFFMHLRHSGLLIAMSVAVLGLWLLILFGMTMIDFVSR